MPFDFLELPYPAMKNFIDQMSKTEFRAGFNKMKKIEETHAVIHRKMDETMAHQSQILKKLEGFYGATKDCDEKKDNDKEVDEDDEDEEEAFILPEDYHKKLHLAENDIKETRKLWTIPLPW
ncbi:unnamed protein product [Caenorhabditis brenneri]